LSGHVLLVSKRSAQSHTLLLQALRAEGYALQVATDTESALLQARQDPPVALILESDLTSQDDLALCQWLRTNPATVAVKMLVTARNTQQRLAAMEAGADELLTYPLDWVEVRARLRSLQAGQTRLPSLEDFLKHTPDLTLGGNAMDILGSADLLAHDLKSPLGIIVSSMEILRELAQDSGLSDQAAERSMALRDGVLLAARRLNFLIDDMLDLAKLEVDAYPLRIEPIDLEWVVQNVLRANEAAIARKGINVSLEAPPDLPAASGDRDLVSRACNALLDVTLKFSNEGDLARWTLAVDGRFVTAALTDHGRPMLPEYREAIFGRGVQWEARQQGSRTSVAMGLPFARTVLRRMGGDLVTAGNPADKTTTFCLRLPLAR
jgi:signal transduction histidine kinase